MNEEKLKKIEIEGYIMNLKVAGACLLLIGSAYIGGCLERENKKPINIIEKRIGDENYMFIKTSDDRIYPMIQNNNGFFLNLRDYYKSRLNYEKESSRLVKKFLSEEGECEGEENN
ncbi:MAG TPA: hypothetical protein P5277_01480 [Candidatus Paceibacterota bacterium]|nr:hypothetical protein [Candidatus Paceibacterota bacterium]